MRLPLYLAGTALPLPLLLFLLELGLMDFEFGPASIDLAPVFVQFRLACFPMLLALAQDLTLGFELAMLLIQVVRSGSQLCFA